MCSRQILSWLTPAWLIPTDPKKQARQRGNYVLALATGVAFFLTMRFLVMPVEHPELYIKPCEFCIEGQSANYVFALAETEKRRDLAFLKSSARIACQSIQPECVVMIWENPDTVPLDDIFGPANQVGQIARFYVNWTSRVETICPVIGGQVISDRCF